MLPFCLAIVADGMGGHKDGHEASRKTARIVARRVMEGVYLPLLSGENAGTTPVHEILTEAVKEANSTIHNPDPEKDMGTTLTAALILGKRVYLAHVGDSHAYLLHDGNLELLTTDHSYVQRLMDAGQLTPEEAAVHPQRNVLYRAVGQGGDLEVDTYTRSLPREGKLLLCSDGLWGFVSQEQIVATLDNGKSLSEQAEFLVEQALARGSNDNVTAVIVAYSL
jgi:protein phosphatase